MKFNSKKAGSASRAVAVTVLFFAVSIVSSQCFAQSSVDSQAVSKYQYIRRISSVFDYVQQNYVDEVDPRVLYEGAMKGMLEALKDPYTLYLDPSSMRQLSDTTAGSFGGVGLSISKPFESVPGKPAYVEVESPIDDTPGERAGIHSGDFITAIDGSSTEDMTM